MKQFEYKVIAPAVNLALTTRQYEQQARNWRSCSIRWEPRVGNWCRKRMDSTSSSGRNPLLRNNSRIKTACPQVRFMPERTGCSCFAQKFTAWAAR